jgi:precorrin-2 dehydrogenase/sirohydrochlorin ferrochelatase
LQVTVSTDGAAPGLARVLRDHLGDRIFGPEWAVRVQEIAGVRQRWRAEGMSMVKLGEAIVDYIKSRGWLDAR